MTENKNKTIGGLVLAAGGSRRLGVPKQLVEYGGETLLCRAVNSVIAAFCRPVVVVLGAEIEESQKAISGLPVEVCINAEWKEGMGSSIRSGLARLLELDLALDAVLITLCDQPRITPEHLTQFVKIYNDTGANVIAALYNNIAGVPVLFASDLFPELRQLRGDKGARDLIRSQANVLTIDLPEAAFDIDTMDDF